MNPDLIPIELTTHLSSSLVEQTDEGSCMSKAAEDSLKGYGRLYTVEDVAEAAGLSRHKVRSLIASRELPALRLGVELRVAERDLLAFLEASSYEGPDPRRDPLKNRRREGLARPDKGVE